MAKELFAGKKNNSYKILISKEAISKKNLTRLLKEHKKTLIVADDGDALKHASPLVTRHYIQTLKNSSKSNDATSVEEIEHNLEQVKVLLAEDNEVNQMVAAALLTQIGFEDVDIAENGQQVLSLLDNNADYSVILMDCQMPVLDGYDATRRIRQGDAGDTNRAIPIVALTANVMADDKKKCLDAGMNYYLGKPFNIEELCLKIEVFLKRKQISQQIKDKYVVGNYHLDVKEQKLVIGENERKLTLKETKLLSLLVQKVNTVTKRENILINLWGKNDYFLGRSLDVFISRLRKYLKEDERVFIENIRGVGFKLVSEE